MNRYGEIRELALRLLAGEVIDVTDEHGRVWRGEASTLALVQPGTGAVGPVLEGVDAYTVAWRLWAVRGSDITVGSTPCPASA